MLWQPMNLTEVCPADAHITACSSFGYVYLNLLVQLFGGSKDKRIQEKLKREDKYDRIVENLDRCESGKEYDFIVVGAGAAGCVVANRLSENEKWTVLLLEAGIEQPDVTLVPAFSTALMGSNIDWGYSTEPDGKSCLARPGGRCGWPRGKVMGGSSSINSMVYIRGNKVDYDRWAALGNEGWSYKDVLPFFKKSEHNLNMAQLNLSRQYHGVEGEQPVSIYCYTDEPSKMMVEAFNETGLPIADYNGANQVAVMNAQAITKSGIRVSANNAFIQPIRYKRKNLVVKVESEVTKVLINKEKVAYGVKYTRNGKVRTAFAKKEVIVCAGSINSPKLLMLSGIGPKEHLSQLKIPVIQDLAVGENLHDHLTCNGILIALNKSSTRISDDDNLNTWREYKKTKLKCGPTAANGPNNAIAFILAEPNIPAPDIQYQIGYQYLDEYIRETEYAENIVPIFPTIFYDTMIPRPMNLVPKSRGKILLNCSNPNGPPLIYANYLQDPSDLLPVIRGFKYLITLEKTKAFKSRGAYFVKKALKPCTQFKWGTDEYLTCLLYAYTSATHHQVGTCKMGPKCDKKAVLDAKLRVYGVSRLRVIDASMMPFLIRGNTNAPSMMIGERGVAFVVDYWSKKNC